MLMCIDAADAAREFYAEKCKRETNRMTTKLIPHRYENEEGGSGVSVRTFFFLVCSEWTVTDGDLFLQSEPVPLRLIRRSRERELCVGEREET